MACTCASPTHVSTCPVLRDSLLSTVDCARALVADTGVHRYDVTIRTRTWSGTYPGEGSPTDTDVTITPRPRVRVLSTRDVASSGGMYRMGDFRVDRITPRYATGGWSPAMLNVRPTATNQDVTVILTGDEGAVECQVVEFFFDDPFEYALVVREMRTAVGTTRG